MDSMQREERENTPAASGRREERKRIKGVEIERYACQDENQKR